MEIHFTKHAREKFEVLRRHGVDITKDEVIATIDHSDIIDESRVPLFIAQRDWGEGYVLRVVYKIERNMYIVITFYPRACLKT